ncbi:carboxypeptidase regulatory-like domain-containing protein [candidate division WOR-3 bacterium]|nr:carboxypeptidase regulatory-like domain-containing protein [candidate division WOR-3 bacterium]
MILIWYQSKRKTKMALTMPYVTDKFIAYLGDVITTNLSLAVWLTDENTGEKPMGRVKVTLEEGEIKAFKNLSGYHCFTDLSHKDYNLNIESDFYFPADKKIVIPLPDPKKPVDDTILKPNPVYPFPISATLVRGLVSNTGPVVNALVSVVGKTIETITDERGEFVLYFKGIKKEDITIEIRKDGDTKAVNTTIEEGKTISLGIIVFP